MFCWLRRWLSKTAYYQAEKLAVLKVSLSAEVLEIYLVDLKELLKVASMVDVKAFFEVGLFAVLKVVEPVASSVRPLVGELVFVTVIEWVVYLEGKWDSDWV